MKTWVDLLGYGRGKEGREGEGGEVREEVGYLVAGIQGVEGGTCLRRQLGPPTCESSLSAACLPHSALVPRTCHLSGCWLAPYLLPARLAVSVGRLVSLFFVWIKTRGEVKICTRKR